MAGRVTQAVTEVVRDGAPTGRVTQAVTEVVRDGPREGRVTQCVVEVLRSTADALPPGLNGSSGADGAVGQLVRYNSLLGVYE